jgi:hypothetical protein
VVVVPVPLGGGVEPWVAVGLLEEVAESSVDVVPLSGFGHPVVGIELLGDSDLGCAVVGLGEQERLEGSAVFGLGAEDGSERGFEAEVLEGVVSEELVNALPNGKGTSSPAPPGRSESNGLSTGTDEVVPVVDGV